MPEPYILVRSLGRKCGMAEYAGFLADRLPGILVGTVQDLPLQRERLGVVIVQVEVGLYNLDLGEIIWELWAARQRGYIVIADYASEPDFCIGWSKEITKHAILGPKYLEPDSFLLPLIRCDPPIEPDPGPPNELRLGTFGFASPVKKHHEVALLATRLGIKSTVISTMPNPWPGFNEGPHRGVPARALEEIRAVARQFPNNVDLIDYGYLTIPEVHRELRRCSHLVSAMDNLTGNWGPSGSLRTMATAGRPLIALRSQRAAEVDATLIDSLDEVTIEFLESHKSSPQLAKIGDGLWAYRDLMRWVETSIDCGKPIFNLNGGMHVRG